MKTMPCLREASDRMTTREELWQVMSLLEKITAARGQGRSQIPEFPVALAARESSVDSNRLWLDSAEEEASEQALDAGPESLAELFVDGNDPVN